MPFQSEKQRKYVTCMNLPDIAKRWERDYAGGGRSGFNEGSEKKGIMSGVQDFLSDLGWEGIGEELRQERQMMKIAFDIIPTFTYPKHVRETSEQLKRYKKLEMGYADTGNFLKDLGLAYTRGAGRKPGEQWEKYRKFLEMENYEKANQPEGFATGGISNHFKLKEGGRTGFFTGAQADTASGKSMSPGTSASGGGRDGPPGQSTVATHQPTTITTTPDKGDGK